MVYLLLETTYYTIMGNLTRSTIPPEPPALPDALSFAFQKLSSWNDKQNNKLSKNKDSG